MTPASMAVRDSTGLKSAIDAAGLAIADVADAAGVTRQFLHLLMRGQRRCNPTVAAAISASVGVSIDLFFIPQVSDSSNNTQEDAVTPITSVTEDPYLNFEDVAQLAKMAPKSLRYIRNSGRGPAFRRVGKRLKIRQSKAVEWIEAYGEDN